MKNLFKNLMLVAVAAMAFTACTETNDEVNAVSKKTVIKGVATIDNNGDDTRSAFGDRVEDENGNFYYESNWEGGEYIRLHFSAGFSDYAEVDAAGNFEIEYIGDFDPGTTVTICSPDDSWSNVNTFVIPSEQTPLKNSVDPLAHILKSDVTEIVNNTISATMNHVAAYGKMTINGFDGKNISSVKVELNGESENHTYTLDVAGLSEHTYWFATEAINVTSFTVTAIVDGVSYSKTIDMEGKLKPLAFNIGKVSTFSVSDLVAVVEPEGPVFTSASSDATTSNYNDCYLTFEGENLGTLELNAYHVVNNILELPVGSYMLTEAPGNFWTAGYSTFIPAGTDTQHDITSGTVKVSVVNDEYVIEFIDLAYGSNVLNATYTGTITGLILADPRQELPIPSNVKATVSGKTITLTWNPVEHANGYQVMMWNPEDEKKIEVVTDTQYVFEAQKSNTTYHFNVYSYANDDNASYKTSLNWSYVYVTTEDTDPKIILSKESISFKADGGNDAVDVTLKNIDGDFTYTVDADWLTVTRPDSGASLAVSAPAYDNESEDRSATITITAGELTKEIPVTQSKKAAQGSGDEGTEANPYVFTSVVIAGGPAMNLSGANNGASMHIELWGTDFSAYDGQTLALGEGQFYHSYNTYTVNGTTYDLEGYNADQVAVTIKKIADHEVELKFMVNVDGTPVYYVVNYKS